MSAHHTPAEMREMAGYWAADASELRATLISVPRAQIETREQTADMLRQAADAMEKIERRKSLDELAALSQELGLYDMPAKDTP